MRNATARVFALTFCASLAAGLFTNVAEAQQCQPTFTRIEPATEGVPADSNSTVTVYGSCLPTDINRVFVGFSDEQNVTGLPVQIVALQPDQIRMTVTTPVVQRQSRRNFSAQIDGRLIRTPLFLRINPIVQSNQQAPATQTTEYVTRPVLFAAIRKVDAKADRAIGLAQQASKAAAATEAKVTVLQNATINMGARAEEMFGKDGNGGTFGTRLSAAEDGLAEHSSAIQQIRGEIDKINSRPIPVVATPPQQSTELSQKLDELSRRLAAHEQLLQSILTARIKTGAKQELGQAIGLTRASQPPQQQPAQQTPGGYRNPIQ